MFKYDFLIRSLKTIFLNIIFLYVYWVIEVERQLRFVMIWMIIGLILFVGFSLLDFVGMSPLGTAFNDFFTMIGIILFFIAGFFYLSKRTVKE